MAKRAAPRSKKTSKQPAPQEQGDSGQVARQEPEKIKKKDEDDEPAELPERDEELCTKEDIREQVTKIMKDVDTGFQAQWDRGNDILDYWDCYDCTLNGHQAYAGNSQIYAPIIRDAIDARKTRFVNQIFPRSNRNVDCITSDDKPWSLMALLEHYVRRTKLRTQVMPPLMKNGDVEGQYSIYLGWDKHDRHVAYRVPGAIEMEDGEEVPNPDEDAGDDIEEEVFEEAGPFVEVVPDCDVLVMPFNSASVMGAVRNGGSATILRRWSQARLEKAVDSGEVHEEEGEDLVESLKSAKTTENFPDATKKHVDAAGIHGEGTKKYIIIHETWTMLKIDGKRRLCKILYAGNNQDRDCVLSVKRNPNWNDMVPLLSAPQDKIAGVFKGTSKVKHCGPWQYAANDAANMAWDSAQYSMMPIVMTDPSKNPRVGSMVLNLAAIWETDPQSTQFAKFPELWKDGMQMVAGAKQEIFQALSVSPAAITQSSGRPGAKRNQAEIANEQQVDILSTADVCINLEDEILTPLLRWFVDLDHQFRDKPITVREYGELGQRLEMTDIPPIQSNKRYEFRWFGVEATRAAQMIQIQMATLNMLRGVPPQQMEGYKFNAVPIYQLMIENAFGSRLAPQLFTNIKDQLTVSPEQENEYLLEGLDLPVHVLDDDKKHMEVHIEALKQGDPTGSTRQHMLQHRMQMDKKMQAQQQAIMQMQQGQQGRPGGAGPGVAGTPRQGAIPGPQRGGQQPPGVVHQDQMQDAGAAPRR